MIKRLALNTEGNITFCSATEESMGKGRCNHIAHQKDGENKIDFLNRASSFKEKQEKDLENTTLFKSFKKLQEKQESENKNNQLLKDFKKKNEITGNIYSLSNNNGGKDKGDLKINKTLKFFDDLYKQGTLDKEDKELIEDEVKNIFQYGKVVMSFDDNIKELKSKYKDSEWRQNYSKLDADRRMAHNSAMTSINMINRLSKIYGGDEMYTKTANDENRQTVTADIIDMVEFKMSYLKDL